MTDPSGPPSRNPTNDGSMIGMLNVVLRKFLERTDDMLPAQVVAYDRQTNMASVHPLISMVTTLNTIVPRAQVAQVPVLQIGGGGFVLNFPIRKGDLGWIKSNDRDISFFKQFWRMVTPATRRLHSFEDAIFIPSILTGFSISASDGENMVLQSLDASIRLSIGTNHACISDQTGYSQSASAVLDVQSVTKAFKVPAMTEGQRNAIPSPVPGMLVYVLDTPSPHLSVYDVGTGWS